jgi:hypothetical protein
MTLTRSGIKPGKGFKPRAKFLRAASRSKPASSAGVLRVDAVQREKRTKKSRPKATPADRAHMGAVAAMGCCLCEHLGSGATPAEVHHVRARHGWGRSGHDKVIPLCRAHHTGQPGGVHDMGREEFTALYGVSEIELLERVTLRLISGKVTSSDLAAIPKQISLEQ